MTTPIDQQWTEVDQVTFKKTMGSLAAGVTIVTTRDRSGEPRGLTCSAVCSLSATPPLLLACLHERSSTLAAIQHSGSFAVNILAAGTADIARTFASPVPERFAGTNWYPGPRTDAPLFEDTVAWAECAVVDALPMGDHQMVVGRLVNGRALSTQRPLVYWRAQFSDIPENA
ncbi:flavin reductase [Nocardia sp. ET3-3]|uniref:Flavin reductase n=1 Tax=Nocardia terrae TaxID=2675851 RepID=A0A7K1V489_9NOCA|nr:flavin reductase family protein [Nocardia terrae]MVU81337.1 flavin reductase [Nocardia terrae]